MKRSPDEESLSSRLGPTKFSAEGFMGDDRRPVVEIVDSDRRDLEETGIDKVRLVAELRSIYSKAKGRFGAPVEVAPGIVATYNEARGRIPSPFRGDGTFEKGEVVLTSDKGADPIIITSLSIHLIEKHDFFQGRGSRYRIDPATVVELLGGLFGPPPV